MKPIKEIMPKPKYSSMMKLCGFSKPRLSLKCPPKYS